MASNQESYASRSWALLTKDEGWIKPVLVLAAARLIPIIGPFGANGYALEWARLTSWGVDSAPKQKNVDVAGCIKSGARAFVVAIGYGFVFGILRAVLTPIFGGFLAVPLTLAISAAAMVIGSVAKLRATIYQKIPAGYQVDRIADMIKRDYKGLARIAGFGMLLMMGVGLVVSMTIGLAFVLRLGSIVPRFIAMGDIEYADEMTIVLTTLGAIADMMPIMFVLSYFVHIAGTISDLLINTAVALWMRQFDVRNWGESSDPLPGDAKPYAASQGAPASQETATTSTSAYAGAPSTPAPEQSNEHVAAEGPKPAVSVDDALQRDINEQFEALAREAKNDDATIAERAEETSVETFALDEETSAEEPQVETFTLDDSITEQDVVEPQVETFTLDDDAPADEPAEESAVEAFTLDDPAPVAEHEEAQVESFTLDESAPANAAEEAAEFIAAEGRFTLDDTDPVEDERDADDVLDEIKSAIAEADLSWPEIPYEQPYHSDAATREEPGAEPKVETFDLDDFASEGKPVPPEDTDEEAGE
ncbi:MAG: DUF4013 domain-containing protein [Atopobiaceae bacterium]|nr:DUF4013 domain-containing protein [Atopobiaceae bacterium]